MANTFVPMEATPDWLGVLDEMGSPADANQTETEADRTVRSPNTTLGERTDATWVARTLIELTDTVESDVGLQSLGGLLATRYAELVGDIEMGILLNDQTGGLHEAYASTERMQVLQSSEIGYLEGPAIDCALSGKAAVNLRLENTDEMWPRVVPWCVLWATEPCTYSPCVSTMKRLEPLSCATSMTVWCRRPPFSSARH